MMTAKSFRFGVNLFTPGSRSAWRDTVRHAEDIGYDVLLVPDHLGGMPAPFPALVSAAEATTRVRLGTLVLNSGFYRPALLARDVAAVHELTDGRFELGLGTGLVAEEYAAAGIPFPSPGRRVDHLERTATEVVSALTDAGHRVPLMIAGQGRRVLTLAAQRADIVNIAGVSNGDDPLASRVDLIREAAGERFADIELSLFVAAVHIAGSGTPNLTLPRSLYPHLSEDELLALPNVLHGTEQDIADRIRELRDTYGITYFAVTAAYQEPFATVISQFR